MFDKFIANLLTTHLGRYFENIDREQVKVSIWNGKVKLRGLRVRTDVLRRLDIAICVKEGTIGELDVIVPWTRLQSESVVVELRDVVLVLHPKKAAPRDEARELELRRELRSAQLALFDLLLQQEDVEQRAQCCETSDLSEQHAEHVKRDSTFSARLKAAVLNNIKIVVERVVVCYEDKFVGQNGEVVAATAKLDRFTTYACNAMYQPAFTPAAERVLFKSASIQGLQVFVGSTPEAHVATGSTVTGETLLQHLFGERRDASWAKQREASSSSALHRLSRDTWKSKGEESDADSVDENDAVFHEMESSESDCDSCPSEVASVDYAPAAGDGDAPGAASTRRAAPVKSERCSPGAAGVASPAPAAQAPWRHFPICEPMDAHVRMQHQPIPYDTSIPTWKLSIEVTRSVFSLSRRDWDRVWACVHEMKHYEQREQFRQFRPAGDPPPRPTVDPRRWWHFAQDCVLHEVRRARCASRFCGSQYVLLKSQREEYAALHKRLEGCRRGNTAVTSGNPAGGGVAAATSGVAEPRPAVPGESQPFSWLAPLSSDELAVHDTLEQSLPVDVVKLGRRLAYARLRLEEQQHRIIVAQRKLSASTRYSTAPGAATPVREAAEAAGSRFEGESALSGSSDECTSQPAVRNWWNWVSGYTWRRSAAHSVGSDEEDPADDPQDREEIEQTINLMSAAHWTSEQRRAIAKEFGVDASELEDTNYSTDSPGAIDAAKVGGHEPGAGGPSSTMSSPSRAATGVCERADSHVVIRARVVFQLLSFTLRDYEEWPFARLILSNVCAGTERYESGGFDAAMCVKSLELVDCSPQLLSHPAAARGDERLQAVHSPLSGSLASRQRRILCGAPERLQSGPCRVAGDGGSRSTQSATSHHSFLPAYMSGEKPGLTSLGDDVHWDMFALAARMRHSAKHLVSVGLRRSTCGPRRSSGVIGSSKTQQRLSSAIPNLLRVEVNPMDFDVNVPFLYKCVSFWGLRGGSLGLARAPSPAGAAKATADGSLQSTLAITVEKEFLADWQLDLRGLRISIPEEGLEQKASYFSVAMLRVHNDPERKLAKLHRFADGAVGECEDDWVNYIFVDVRGFAVGCSLVEGPALDDKLRQPIHYDCVRQLDVQLRFMKNILLAKQPSVPKLTVTVAMHSPVELHFSRASLSVLCTSLSLLTDFIHNVMRRGLLGEHGVDRLLMAREDDGAGVQNTGVVPQLSRRTHVSSSLQYVLVEEVMERFLVGDEPVMTEQQRYYNVLTLRQNEVGSASQACEHTPDPLTAGIPSVFPSLFTPSFRFTEVSRGRLTIFHADRPSLPQYVVELATGQFHLVGSDDGLSVVLFVERGGLAHVGARERLGEAKKLLFEQYQLPVINSMPLLRGAVRELLHGGVTWRNDGGSQGQRVLSRLEPHEKQAILEAYQIVETASHCCPCVVVKLTCSDAQQARSLERRIINSACPEGLGAAQVGKNRREALLEKGTPAQLQQLALSLKLSIPLLTAVLDDAELGTGEVGGVCGTGSDLTALRRGGDEDDGGDGSTTVSESTNAGTPRFFVLSCENVRMGIEQRTFDVVVQFGSESINLVGRRPCSSSRSAQGTSCAAPQRGEGDITLLRSGAAVNAPRVASSEVESKDCIRVTECTGFIFELSMGIHRALPQPKSITVRLPSAAHLQLSSALLAAVELLWDLFGISTNHVFGSMTLAAVPWCKTVSDVVRYAQMARRAQRQSSEWRPSVSGAWVRSEHEPRDPGPDGTDRSFLHGGGIQFALHADHGISIDLFYPDTFKQQLRQRKEEWDVDVKQAAARAAAVAADPKKAGPIPPHVSPLECDRLLNDRSAGPVVQLSSRGLRVSWHADDYVNATSLAFEEPSLRLCMPYDEGKSDGGSPSSTIGIVIAEPKTSTARQPEGHSFAATASSPSPSLSDSPSKQLSCSAVQAPRFVVDFHSNKPLVGLSVSDTLLLHGTTGYLHTQFLYCSATSLKMNFWLNYLWQVIESLTRGVLGRASLLIWRRPYIVGRQVLRWSLLTPPAPPYSWSSLHKHVQLVDLDVALLHDAREFLQHPQQANAEPPVRVWATIPSMTVHDEVVTEADVGTEWDARATPSHSSDQDPTVVPQSADPICWMLRTEELGSVKRFLTSGCRRHELRNATFITLENTSIWSKSSRTQSRPLTKAVLPSPREVVVTHPEGLKVHAERVVESISVNFAIHWELFSVTGTQSAKRFGVSLGDFTFHGASEHLAGVLDWVYGGLMKYPWVPLFSSKIDDAKPPHLGYRTPAFFLAAADSCGVKPEGRVTTVNEWHVHTGDVCLHMKDPPTTYRSTVLLPTSTLACHGRDPGVSFERTFTIYERPAIDVAICVNDFRLGLVWGSDGSFASEYVLGAAEGWDLTAAAAVLRRERAERAKAGGAVHREKRSRKKEVLFRQHPRPSVPESFCVFRLSRGADSAGEVGDNVRGAFDARFGWSFSGEAKSVESVMKVADVELDVLPQFLYGVRDSLLGLRVRNAFGNILKWEPKRLGTAPPPRSRQLENWSTKHEVALQSVSLTLVDVGRHHVTPLFAMALGNVRLGTSSREFGEGSQLYFFVESILSNGMVVPAARPKEHDVVDGMALGGGGATARPARKRPEALRPVIVPQYCNEQQARGRVGCGHAAPGSDDGEDHDQLLLEAPPFPPRAVLKVCWSAKKGLYGELASLWIVAPLKEEIIWIRRVWAAQSLAELRWLGTFAEERLAAQDGLNLSPGELSSGKAHEAPSPAEAAAPSAPLHHRGSSVFFRVRNPCLVFAEHSAIIRGSPNDGHGVVLNVGEVTFEKRCGESATSGCADYALNVRMVCLQSLYEEMHHLVSPANIVLRATRSSDGVLSVSLKIDAVEINIAQRYYELLLHSFVRHFLVSEEAAFESTDASVGTTSVAGSETNGRRGESSTTSNVVGGSYAVANSQLQRSRLRAERLTVKQMEQYHKAGLVIVVLWERFSLLVHNEAVGVVFAVEEMDVHLQSTTVPFYGDLTRFGAASVSEETYFAPVQLVGGVLADRTTHLSASIKHLALGVENRKPLLTLRGTAPPAPACGVVAEGSAAAVAAVVGGPSVASDQRGPCGEAPWTAKEVVSVELVSHNNHSEIAVDLGEAQVILAADTVVSAITFLYEPYRRIVLPQLSVQQVSVVDSDLSLSSRLVLSARKKMHVSSKHYNHIAMNAHGHEIHFVDAGAPLITLDPGVTLRIVNAVVFLHDKSIEYYITAGNGSYVELDPAFNQVVRSDGDGRSGDPVAEWDGMDEEDDGGGEVSDADGAAVMTAMETVGAAAADRQSLSELPLDDGSHSTTSVKCGPRQSVVGAMLSEGETAAAGVPATNEEGKAPGSRNLTPFHPLGPEDKFTRIVAKGTLEIMLPEAGGASFYSYRRHKPSGNASSAHGSLFPGAAAGSELVPSATPLPPPPHAPASSSRASRSLVLHANMTTRLTRVCFKGGAEEMGAFDLHRLGAKCQYLDPFGHEIDFSSLISEWNLRVSLTGKHRPSHPGGGQHARTTAASPVSHARSSHRTPHPTSLRPTRASAPQSTSRAGRSTVVTAVEAQGDDVELDVQQSTAVRDSAPVEDDLYACEDDPIALRTPRAGHIRKGRARAPPHEMHPLSIGSPHDHRLPVGDLHQPHQRPEDNSLRGDDAGETEGSSVRSISVVTKSNVEMRFRFGDVSLVWQAVQQALQALGHIDTNMFSLLPAPNIQDEDRELASNLKLKGQESLGTGAGHAALGSTTVPGYRGDTSSATAPTKSMMECFISLPLVSIFLVDDRTNVDLPLFHTRLENISTPTTQLYASLLKLHASMTWAVDYYSLSTSTWCPFVEPVTLDVVLRSQKNVSLQDVKGRKGSLRAGLHMRSMRLHFTPMLAECVRGLLALRSRLSFNVHPGQTKGAATQQQFFMYKVTQHLGPPITISFAQDDQGRFPPSKQLGMKEVFEFNFPRIDGRELAITQHYIVVGFKGSTELVNIGSYGRNVVPMRSGLQESCVIVDVSVVNGQKVVNFRTNVTFVNRLPFPIVVRSVGAVCPGDSFTVPTESLRYRTSFVPQVAFKCHDCSLGISYDALPHLYDQTFLCSSHIEDASSSLQRAVYFFICFGPKLFAGAGNLLDCQATFEAPFFIVNHTGVPIQVALMRKQHSGKSRGILNFTETTYYEHVVTLDIGPEEQSAVTQMDPLCDVYLDVFLQQASGESIGRASHQSVKVTPALIHSENKKSRARSITLSDQCGSTLVLHFDYSGRDVIVWCPYWIVNQTSHYLQVADSHPKKKTNQVAGLRADEGIGPGGKPFLVNSEKFERMQDNAHIYLRVGRHTPQGPLSWSQWSVAIPVYPLSECEVVQCSFGVYAVSVSYSVDFVGGTMKDTRVIKFRPRWIIVNRTGGLISFRQRGLGMGPDGVNRLPVTLPNDHSHILDVACATGEQARSLHMSASAAPVDGGSNVIQVRFPSSGMEIERCQWSQSIGVDVIGEQAFNVRYESTIRRDPGSPILSPSQCIVGEDGEQYVVIKQSKVLLLSCYRTGGIMYVVISKPAVPPYVIENRTKYFVFTQQREVAEKVAVYPRTTKDYVWEDSARSPILTIWASEGVSMTTKPISISFDPLSVIKRPQQLQQELRFPNGMVLYVRVRSMHSTSYAISITTDSSIDEFLQLPFAQFLYQLQIDSVYALFSSEASDLMLLTAKPINVSLAQGASKDGGAPHEDEQVFDCCIRVLQIDDERPFSKQKVVAQLVDLQPSAVHYRRVMRRSTPLMQMVEFLVRLMPLEIHLEDSFLYDTLGFAERVRRVFGAQSLFVEHLEEFEACPWLAELTKAAARESKWSRKVVFLQHLLIEQIIVSISLYRTPGGEHDPMRERFGFLSFLIRSVKDARLAWRRIEQHGVYDKIWLLGALYSAYYRHYLKQQIPNVVHVVGLDVMRGFVTDLLEGYLSTSTVPYLVGSKPRTGRRREAQFVGDDLLLMVMDSCAQDDPNLIALTAAHGHATLVPGTSPQAYLCGTARTLGAQQYFSNSYHGSNSLIVQQPAVARRSAAGVEGPAGGHRWGFGSPAVQVEKIATQLTWKDFCARVSDAELRESGYLAVEHFLRTKHYATASQPTALSPAHALPPPMCQRCTEVDLMRQRRFESDSLSVLPHPSAGIITWDEFAHHVSWGEFAHICTGSEVRRYADLVLGCIVGQPKNVQRIEGESQWCLGE